ncbi:MAG: GNAT family N-acetyltransferase [Polyangiaceae bacterium]
MASLAELSRPSIRQVTPADAAHFGEFRCGDSGEDEDFTDFLRDDALDFQTLRTVSTYLSFRGDRLAGYVTLLTDAVLLKSAERKKLRSGDIKHSGQGHPVVPALKVAHLAVSSDLQRTGIGTSLLRFALFSALEVSETAGCRLLTLDALPGRVEYYKKRGFELNLDDAYKGKPRVSMRYDVFRAHPPEWAARPE